MFYNNNESYTKNLLKEACCEMRNEAAQSCHRKFLKDLENEDGRFWKQERQTWAAEFYRQQLLQEERQLLLEFFLLAMLFEYYAGPSFYNHRESHPHLRRNHRPHNLGEQTHNLSRPHNWLSAMEKSPNKICKKLCSLDNEVLEFSTNLIAKARHNLGQPVWAFTKFASVCQSGNLGCAATVSELLQESGVKIPGSAGVYGVVDQLSALGWDKIKINDKQQFKPGDVVFGLHGTHAHIGIISQVQNNQVLVCDNSSSSGTLKERTIESGGSFTPNGRFAGSLYVMRQSSG